MALLFQEGATSLGTAQVVQRNTLVELTADADAVSVFRVVLSGVPKARDSADRNTSVNSLKQIALAMHNYLNVYGHLPPAAIRDKEGRPLLSWRVALLPFLEQDQLYKRFKLDEPWDSEHNKKLLAAMPKTYLRPGREAKEPYQTF